MFGAIDASILMSMYEMFLMRESGAFEEEARSGYNRYDSLQTIQTLKWLRKENECDNESVAKTRQELDF